MRNAARLPNAFNVRWVLEGVSGILNQPLIHEGSVAITKAQPRTRVNRRTRYSKWYSTKISNHRFLIFSIRIAFHFSFPRRRLKKSKFTYREFLTDLKWKTGISRDQVGTKSGLSRA